MDHKIILRVDAEVTDLYKRDNHFSIFEQNR